MYNSEIKEKFIEFIKKDDRIRHLRRINLLFEVAETEEQKKEKDIAYFERKEILELFSKMDINSYPKFRTTLKVLNMYLDWYSSNIGKVTKNRFTEQEVEQVISLQEGWNYFSPAQMKSIVEACIQKSTGFLIYALYLGIRGRKFEELALMKLKDINYQNKTVDLYKYPPQEQDGERIFSRRIKIDDTFIALAEETDAERVYTDEKGRLLGFLENSEFIFKYREGSNKGNDKINQKRKYENLKGRLYRINKQDNVYFPDLSVPSIQQSGLINYVKEIAEVLEISFGKEILEDENKIILQRAAVRYSIKVQTAETIIKEYFLKKI